MGTYVRLVPKKHPAATRNAAVALFEDSASARQVSEQLRVPLATARLWQRQLAAGADLRRCDSCWQAPHDPSTLEPRVYAYLLAAYLGDGHVCRTADSQLLRVSLDTAYPGIVAEIAATVECVRGAPVRIDVDRTGKNLVVIHSTWKSWPCLLPQHGPGRKHHRPIVLEPWQQALVDRAPEAFLRGLIHTDGWRGMNRVTVKGRDYAYPRYQFSNRSDDIRTLFTDACDALDIPWRPWGRWHVSVARRDAVARMDEFIGPKR